MGVWTAVLLMAASALGAGASEPQELIEEAGITGGLVAQVGVPDLALKGLGERFHVRLLLADAAAVEKAQAAIDKAGLQGRFTVAAWGGGELPFGERVLNALVLARDGLVPDEEARRVLAPGGLLIAPGAATAMPVPETIDDWTHYLYNASGNAVSKDREVASPRSFRWNAPPRHLRSHNYGASFTGLVSAGGHVFHFLDEGTYLFDKGGGTEPWSLVARDAFNGAFLWKRALTGYGQAFFEDVGGQAVADYIWRSPLTVNRRMVAQGGKVFAALDYRDGPLSVLDAATGETLHAVDLAGIVDEIVAEGDLVVCRVRSEIPMPIEERRNENRWALGQKLQKEGIPADEVRAELNARVLDGLMQQEAERVVAVDAHSGNILWQHDAPHVATQSLAMAEGKVIFHNYEALVALDAGTGEVAWEHACPVVKRRSFGVRSLLGNLLVSEGKVLWASSATGGGVCLNLADGKELWKAPRMGETGGFAFPTGLRAVAGTLYRDALWSPPVNLADGSTRLVPAGMGEMLTRGHHIRCFAGKATERFLITPHRGTEFVDLLGQEHMVNDWVRGACSYGLMPANGLLYVTPDPCTCYAGARITGFMALAAALPLELDRALPPAAPERLVKGPAYSDNPQSAIRNPKSDDWPTYRHDARRTGRASCALSAELSPGWRQGFAGGITQPTVAGGSAYVVKKDTYELLCLDAATGAVEWRRAFAGALDGPPTVVAGRLFIGCGDGHVYSLRASDGAPAWRFLAAPQERLTLSADRLENVWPVSSSVLFHNGLIYAVAGRNSYLDGGIHLYALDPVTGEVRHHLPVAGPWPTDEQVRTAVVTEQDLKNEEDPGKKDAILAKIRAQHATGYSMVGAQADLLVTDGDGLYMMQNKFTPALDQVPLQRVFHTGLTPMGGMHLMANFGFLDETMFHRTFWMFDESWPGYGGGSGWAARAGTMVAVGERRAYAAKHYEGGWYPTHAPGSGNRLVADFFDHLNTSGALASKEILQEFRQYGNAGEVVRTGAPLWESRLPIIVRAMLVAPDGNGGELVFVAGIVEGSTKAEWDKSTNYRGPGKLLVHNGADGKLLAEYDLPACPVFDGMSAASGKLVIPMVNGEVMCWRIANGDQSR